MKLNAAVHHDGDIPKAVGGADGRAGHVTRPDGRRAGHAARHFDAGLHRQVRHGYRGDLAARRELGGKGGDFAGTEEQLPILQIVPAPIERTRKRPAGPPWFSAGESSIFMRMVPKRTPIEPQNFLSGRVIFRTVPA